MQSSSLRHFSLAGIKTPIFASVVEIAKKKPLRAVLLEISQAYAAQKAVPEGELNSESLRGLLKERMAAKKRGAPSSQSGPIVINPRAKSPPSE